MVNVMERLVEGFGFGICIIYPSNESELQSKRRNR